MSIWTKAACLPVDLCPISYCSPLSSHPVTLSPLQYLAQASYCNASSTLPWIQSVPQGVAHSVTGFSLSICQSESMKCVLIDTLAGHTEQTLDSFSLIGRSSLGTHYTFTNQNDYVYMEMKPLLTDVAAMVNRFETI